MADAREYPIVRECGGARFVGILHPVASAASRLGVVIVVGGPQYRVGSHRQFVLTARAFARSGYPVLRFDYRGMGDSDGAQRTFEHVQEDVRVAVDALINECPQVTEVVLYGLCDAASAVLMYCRSDARVAGMILANPWVRTEQGQASAQLWHYYPRRLLQKSFWTKLFSGQLGFGRAAQGFLGVLRRSHTQAGSTASAAAAKGTSFIERMLDGFAGFQGRILLLISERDLTAAEFTDLCKRSRPWGKALRRRGVAVKLLRGADHTFSARRDLDDANAACVEWLVEAKQG